MPRDSLDYTGFNANWVIHEPIHIASHEMWAEGERLLGTDRPSNVRRRRWRSASDDQCSGWQWSVRA